MCSHHGPSGVRGTQFGKPWLKVYTEEITREIKNSSYVSVQADETTDISCKSQFVIIVRYVKDFEPVERFLKFVELQDRTANGLRQALKENLDSFNLKSKLIAQAYDDPDGRCFFAAWAVSKSVHCC